MKMLAILMLLASPAQAQSPQPPCNGVGQAITVDPVIGWKCATLPIPPQRSDIYSGSTGFSYTVPNGVTIEVISAGALLSNGTITLPSTPADGMPLTIESPNGVTTISIQPNTGQSLPSSILSSVFGTLPTLAPNKPYRLKYSGVNSTWYPN